MAACRIAARSSLILLETRRLRRTQRILPSPPLSSHSPFSTVVTNQTSRTNPNAVSTRYFASISAAAPSAEVSDVESPEDTVEQLLTHPDDVVKFMKMERRPVGFDGGECVGRWFPYVDRFSCGSSWLNSGEVLEALSPIILDSRKERFKNVVRNRSYSVCLVVEGLSDFGNVSAAFRSADALGFQSVHVVSCDASKRCSQ